MGQNIRVVVILAVVLMSARISPGQELASTGDGASLIEDGDAVTTQVDWDARLRNLESEIDVLRRMVETDQVVTAIPAAPAQPKYPNARLSGFFQADYGLIDQDLINQATVGDAENGADFRRARLAGVGNVAPNVAFSIEMDFAFAGRPSFMDVWLEVQDLPLAGNIRLGQFRQPFGMSAMTSVRELQFLERGLPFALLPFRQIGVMAYDQEFDGLATWAVSGFRFPTDVFGSAIGDNSGGGISTRVTALPIYCEGSYLVHVGANFSSVHSYTDRFQYRATPEFATTEAGGGVPGGAVVSFPFFVDTGLLSADVANLYGAELAFQSGSFYAQSELIFNNVEQIGAPQANFSGGYAQAAYLLTREVRAYNTAAGTFGRLKPRHAFGQGGYGALEATIRYSYIDLTDDNVIGGRLDDVTAGLNWYLNDNTKLQINYIRAFLDPVGALDSEADIVGMRAQIDF